ncbi:MAG: hypothetical protein GEU28_00395 [Dehalococcoidia bacterium]|nr:hypothetical protein [Dehalococcoidia bacterium]
MVGEAAVFAVGDETRKVLERALEPLQLRLREVQQPEGDSLKGLRVLVVDLSSDTERGLEVIQRFRSTSPDAIVLACGGDGVGPAIAALEEGADVHIAAGARPAHVTAQLRALLRRSRPQEADQIKVGSLELDVTRREATAANQQLRLTPGEFKVLAHLAANPGRVVSHPDLYYAMQGVALPDEVSREPVKVLISRLRNKLQEVGLVSPAIRTVRGFGYVLDRRAQRAPAPAGERRAAEG